MKALYLFIPNARLNKSEINMCIVELSNIIYFKKINVYLLLLHTIQCNEIEKYLLEKLNYRQQQHAIAAVVMKLINCSARFFNLHTLTFFKCLV